MERSRQAQWLAIYCRISRDSQKLGLGVKRQETECRDLARRSFPKQAIKLYVDNDLSAFSTKTIRPEYQSLLNDLKAGHVSAVIAMHPDRLHRSPRELEDFIDIIEDSGAEVATVRAGQYDLAGASGRLTARIVGATSRHESERKAERIRDKHIELAADGRPNGGAGYGYRNSKDRQGRATLAIEPTEAKVVHEIADRLLRGESMTSIANDLTDRGVPTARGGKRWQTATIRAVVTKPSIAGLRVHKGGLSDATWKPILDRETWERLCALLGSSATVTGADGKQHHVSRMRSKSRTYLLTAGLARCGLCGASLMAQARTWKAKGVSKKPIYQCPPKVRGGCGGVAIIAEEFEEYVELATLHALDSDKVAQALVQQKDDPRTPLLADIAKAQAKLDSLASMYGEEQIDDRQWLLANQPWEEKLNAAQAQLAALPADITVATNAESIISEWPSYSLAQKQRVISLVFERVELHKATPGTKAFDIERIKMPRRKVAKTAASARPRRKR